MGAFADFPGHPPLPFTLNSFPHRDLSSLGLLNGDFPLNNVCSPRLGLFRIRETNP